MLSQHPLNGMAPLQAFSVQLARANLSLLLLNIKEKNVKGEKSLLSTSCSYCSCTGCEEVNDFSPAEAAGKRLWSLH